MGDISVIARRLPDANNNYVQYGWGGNSGYFSNLGSTLLKYYNAPDMVDYCLRLVK